MTDPPSSADGPASLTPRFGESELRLLERLSLIVNSLDRPDEVLEGLMDLFLSAMGAERGLILHIGDDGEPQPLVNRKLGPEAVDQVRASWSRRAIEEMAGAGHVVVSEDVASDRRFRDSASILANDIRSLLCAPIRIDGQLRGAIYIDHRNHSRQFTDRDIEFARALAELSAVTMARSEAVQALQAENIALRERAARYQFLDVIGASDAMQRMFGRLAKALAAPREFAILLTGENGTGKTQIAKLLHRESDRRDKPFVTFGAGSVPESLAESELFGHKRGSFTGANADQLGLVARADGGTLFLDDVDALPPALQPKLLSFLQDREFRPIGGKTERADLRIIGATNANLGKLVATGKFREDLFYRLNGITIEVPALRQRREDILLLARHFLSQYSKAVEKELRGFEEGALNQIMAYSWPGNVRELMSEVVHAVTMTTGPFIKVKDFKSAALRNAGGRGQPIPDTLNLEVALQATTSQLVSDALEQSADNISRAAKALGVSRGKLYDLMQRAGVRAAHTRRGRPPAASSRTKASGRTKKK